MALFPILLPVFGSIAFLSFFSARFGGGTHLTSLPLNVQTVRDPAIKSFFLFVPLFLIRLAYLRFVDVPYTLGAQYLRYLIADFLGPYFVLTVSAFFFNRRLRREPPLDQYIGYLAFFSVYLVLFGVVSSIINDYYWTVYELLLRPILLVVLAAVVPVAVTRADTAAGGGWAVLYLLAAPLLAAIPAMLAAWLLTGAAVLVTVAVVVLSAAAIWWELFRST